MSDHLPECTLAPGACLAPGPHQEADGFCWKCHSHCVCDRLRACEQRVLLSKPNIELSAVYGYEAGRSDGLDAARDAVLQASRAPEVDGLMWTHEAIAAIDGIRREANDAN